MSEENAKKNKKRVTVYSNVKKEKAEYQSALEENDIINLDNEIVIGLAQLPDPRIKKKQSNNNEKIEKNNYNERTTISVQQLKRKIIKKLSIFLFLLILLIGGFVCFLLSPTFNVKVVDVKNNNLFTTEQIILMSDVSYNENIFRLHKKRLKNNLLSNPYIEDATIKTEPFNSKVIINVKEREATFMLQNGESYIYMNNQGYILENSTERINVPIIEGYKTPLENIKPGSRLEEEDLNKLGIVLKILEIASNNGMGNIITLININDVKEFYIKMESEDKTVYLGDCSNLSTKMLYVKEMLQRESGIEGEFFLNMDLNKGTPFFREKV